MRCSRKTCVSTKCFYTGEISAIKIVILISGTQAAKFRSLCPVGSEKSVCNGSWPVMLFKRLCLSFPEMTFAVYLYSFSGSIFGPAVTHSIMRGQQISEISFSLAQRNQFRFQVILLSVHLWQLARSRGESTFISVLSPSGPPLSPWAY